MCIMKEERNGIRFSSNLLNKMVLHTKDLQFRFHSFFLFGLLFLLQASTDIKYSRFLVPFDLLLKSCPFQL